ncbi:ribosome hibernation-promoting factor, HPF/YfiA family [Defluviitalea phaphyphila]|uniref:ribosome hibernation-promoting factor, HPF/YfiA family n=1 Tax=Defluviitalea phaphyphila TaxID=1473580 RepID=UPI000731358F|nr:ribosome-associated translation inhibitor RaiA [Defluviitalea phaphyphila]
MRYIISGKNIEVTNALQEKIMDKLSKLEKFFVSDTEAQVTLSVEKLRHIIEVTIPFQGTILRAEVEDKDMYAAIDEVVDILERQLLKFKNRLKDKHRENSPFKQEFIKNIEEEKGKDEEIIIQKTKRFAIKPMNVEEAAMQMDLLGHNFFVFRNAETDEVNVVYKRKNGTYGLIEPEF